MRRMDITCLPAALDTQEAMMSEYLSREYPCEGCLSGEGNNSCLSVLVFLKSEKKNPRTAMGKIVMLLLMVIHPPDKGPGYQPIPSWSGVFFGSR